MYARLKQFREKLGLTQAEFGKSIGIAKSTYNNYETGIRDPKSDFWIAVAKKYHVTIDYLMGFSDNPYEISESAKTVPLYSSEALALADNYDKRLDTWGQKQVRTVMDNELSRLRESRKQEGSSAASEIIQFSVTEYDEPMSAGTGQPAGYGYGNNLLLTKEPPRGTSYVAPIAGDSMEPTYHDGDKLFIQACYSIEVGEIGVFYMDGQQWVKELGEGVLLSHNPEYAPRPMTEDIHCQGRVLGVCDESYYT